MLNKYELEYHLRVLILFFGSWLRAGLALGAYLIVNFQWQQQSTTNSKAMTPIVTATVMIAISVPEMTKNCTN